MISIDVFTHVLPRSYRRAAERVIPNFGGKYPFMRENLLTDLDMRLVANPPRSVQIISVPVIEEAEKTMDTHTFEATNSELENDVLDHPELFLGAIARLDMRDVPWSTRFVIDTIARSDSLVGIQMLTRENGTPLTDARFSRLWTAIDISRRPVFLHPRAHARNMALCRAQWVKDLTQAVADLSSSTLLASHPHVRIVLHGGALVPADTLAPLARLDGGRRVYVDTALATSEKIAVAAKTLGTDHVLFSSEAPFASTGKDPLDMESAAMQAVHDAHLGTKGTAAILGDTFRAIRRSLPVNVKSEADEYKDEKAAAARKEAEEKAEKAREQDAADEEAQKQLDKERARAASQQGNVENRNGTTGGNTPSRSGSR